ncbi:hypothetical protein P7C70_g672, partial [Phenoliferia sp. Uapishka_3]
MSEISQIEMYVHVQWQNRPSSRNCGEIDKLRGGRFGRKLAAAVYNASRAPFLLPLRGTSISPRFSCPLYPGPGSDVAFTMDDLVARTGSGPSVTRLAVKPRQLASSSEAPTSNIMATTSEESATTSEEVLTPFSFSTSLSIATTPSGTTSSPVLDLTTRSTAESTSPADLTSVASPTFGTTSLVDTSFTSIAVTPSDTTSSPAFDSTTRVSVDTTFSIDPTAVSASRTSSPVDSPSSITLVTLTSRTTAALSTFSADPPTASFPTSIDTSTSEPPTSASSVADTSTSIPVLTTSPTASSASPTLIQTSSSPAITTAISPSSTAPVVTTSSSSVSTIDFTTSAAMSTPTQGSTSLSSEPISLSITQSPTSSLSTSSELPTVIFSSTPTSTIVPPTTSTSTPIVSSPALTTLQTIATTLPTTSSPILSPTSTSPLILSTSTTPFSTLDPVTSSPSPTSAPVSTSPTSFADQTTQRESESESVATSATSQATRRATSDTTAVEVFTTTSQSLYTVTSSGRVVIVTSIITQVVTNSASQSSSGGKTLNGADASPHTFFSNTGAVAGTFTVVGLVAAGLLIGLAFFFFRRKRARQLDEDVRVAAGGAGDGGAGVNRFQGEDDDEDERYLSTGSEGTHGAYLTQPGMSSYGAPVVAGAYNSQRLSGGFGTGSSPEHSSHSYLPPGATYTQYQPQQGPYGGADFGQRTSHEGALYPDWAEYVEGEPSPGSSGDTSPREYGGGGGGGGGSAEGIIARTSSPSQHSHSNHGSQQSHSQGHSQRTNSYQRHSMAPLRDSGESYYGLQPPAASQPRNDDRLDPRVASDGASQRSFGDENDYSRRILSLFAKPQSKSLEVPAPTTPTPSLCDASLLHPEVHPQLADDAKAQVDPQSAPSTGLLAVDKIAREGEGEGGLLGVLAAAASEPEQDGCSMEEDPPAKAPAERSPPVASGSSPRPPTSNPTVATSDSDSDSDAEIIFVSTSQPTAKKTVRRKKKANGRSTPTIVISDSPPPVARKITHQGLRPISELQRIARDKRKAREPKEARWPTREEHDYEGCSREEAPSVRDERWASVGLSFKGKGREVVSLEASGGDIAPPLKFSVPFATSPPVTRKESPSLVQHDLSAIKALVPPYPDHPLLRRIAAPLEKPTPSHTSFLRPDVRGTADALDTDLSRSSQQLWTNRFSPQTSAEVLGATSGTSARVLKEWLTEHTLLGDSAVEPTKAKKRRRPVVRQATKPKKHKRSSSSDLDDFIAYSDDEGENLDNDSSDSDGGGPSFRPNSQLAKETFASQLTNLILLRGPHGSGKTSSVHAVAAELGWDVFEVYPGMGKRTAKDIEKYVGDVAKNHMVRGGGSGSPTKKKDPFAGFKRAQSPVKSKTSSKDSPLPQEGETRARQSLILFDEVDILYNEEKDFWTGFANLVALSRRPVVMTCTDISRIPFDTIALQPIQSKGLTSYTLDFAPPEPALAIPFLQLAALSEGHITSPSALINLYDVDSRHPTDLILYDGPSQPLPHPDSPAVRAVPDLRRSLTQLQFECQWALGDTQDGSGWMDVSPERIGRSSWSTGTYARPLVESVVARSGTEDSFESAQLKAEALSFSDSYVARRATLKMEDAKLEYASAGATSLDGPVTLKAPLSDYTQLVSLGREPEIASAIAMIVDWDEAAEALNEIIEEESRLDYCVTASHLIYPKLVDWPAPLLPDPCIFVDYLPFIRDITTADQANAMDPAVSGDMGHVSGRRTRANANVYQRRLPWAPGDFEALLGMGFPDDTSTCPAKLGLDSLHVGLLQLLLLLIFRIVFTFNPRRALRSAAPLASTSARESTGASPTPLRDSAPPATKSHEGPKTPLINPLYPPALLDTITYNFLSITEPSLTSHLPPPPSSSTPQPNPASLSTWTLIYETQNLEVLAHSSTKALYSIQAVFPEVSPKALFATLVDMEKRKEWDSMSSGVEVLEEFEVGGRKGMTVWLGMKGMALIKPKDMCLISLVGRLPPNKSDTLRLYSATASFDHPDAPPKPEYTRMNIKISGFIVEEWGEGSKLSQITDLSGLGSWVPNSVLKIVTQTLIPKSLLKLGRCAASYDLSKSPYAGEGDDWLPPLLGSMEDVPPRVRSTPKEVSASDSGADSDDSINDDRKISPAATKDIHTLVGEIRILSSRLKLLESSHPPGWFEVAPPVVPSWYWLSEGERNALVLSTLWKVLLFESYHSTDFEVHRNWWARKSKKPDYPTAFIIAASLLFHPGLMIVDHIHFQYNGFLLGILLWSIVAAREASLHDIAGRFPLTFAIAGQPLSLRRSLRHSTQLQAHLHLPRPSLLHLPPASPLFRFENKRFVLPTNLRRFIFPGTESSPFAAFQFDRLVELGLIVLSIFAVSFGPFLIAGGPSQIVQIFKRLFPFQRGLNHAYWAGNVWALVSAVDRFLVKYLLKRGWPVSEEALSSASRGLVGETTFGVLPNITPTLTFSITLGFILIFLTKLWFDPTYKRFLDSVVLSAMTSFLWGWHVHEKAVLLFLIPLSLTAVEDEDHLRAYIIASCAGIYSLFPLLIKPIESPIKIIYTLVWCGIVFSSLRRVVYRPLPSLISFLVDYAELAYITGFIFLQFCSSFSPALSSFFTNSPRSDVGFLHDALFGPVYAMIDVPSDNNCVLDNATENACAEMGKRLVGKVLVEGKYEFLPLMVTSLYCAVGLVWAWLRLSWAFLSR